MTELENIPANEADNIQEIAALTIRQLERRYPSPQPILRGVHAKDHGCVKATFKVHENLPEYLRVGVLACAGHEYEALIRFSNASVSVDPDSTPGPGGVAMHGSRGMAVKLLGVAGTPLVPSAEPLTQDFVMVNQPVFAFANVEDYLVLSRIVLDAIGQPPAFFPTAFGGAFSAQAKLTDEHGQPTLKAAQARRTLEIVGRVRNHVTTGTPPAAPGAFQNPPASPLDNQYFSAAPFLLGENYAVKFSAKPVAPVSGEPFEITDPRYLRIALHKRLTGAAARDTVFTFQVQPRTARELAPKIATDIEDATVPWDATEHPFVDVATITIPPQDFETDERRALCESLTFSPWNGLAEHRPLGGINRLRRPVYVASSHHRLGAKGSGGCPMSGLA